MVGANRPTPGRPRPGSPISQFIRLNALAHIKSMQIDLRPADVCRVHIYHNFYRSNARSAHGRRKPSYAPATPPGVHLSQFIRLNALAHIKSMQIDLRPADVCRVHLLSMSEEEFSRRSKEEFSKPLNWPAVMDKQTGCPAALRSLLVVYPFFRNGNASK